MRKRLIYFLLFSAGYFLSNSCSAQRIEFGLGTELIGKTLRDSSGGNFPPGSYSTDTVHHIFAKALVATQGIHLGLFYLGLFENFQAQDIRFAARSGSSSFTHNGNSGYWDVYTHTLYYEEKRKTLGWGIDIGFNLTPHCTRFHTYLGFQAGGEKPLRKKVLTDRDDYTHTSEYSTPSLVASSSSTASSYMKFNDTMIFTGSWFAREEIMLGKNFGLNLSFLYWRGVSPVRLDDISYKRYGFAGSLGLSYSISFAPKTAATN